MLGRNELKSENMQVVKEKVKEGKKRERGRGVQEERGR